MFVWEKSDSENVSVSLRSLSAGGARRHMGREKEPRLRAPPAISEGKRLLCRPECQMIRI